jgi:hypothetical protein
MAITFAKKLAQNQAKKLTMKAQNQAKQYAAQKARQMANAAKKRVNAGITGIVNKHMGNSPQARALANQLKTHTTQKINLVGKIATNKIKTSPGLKL